MATGLPVALVLWKPDSFSLPSDVGVEASGDAGKAKVSPPEAEQVITELPASSWQR
jgi:hypothetical protein